MIAKMKCALELCALFVVFAFAAAMPMLHSIATTKDGLLVEAPKDIWSDCGEFVVY